MSGLGRFGIDEVLTFSVVTHDPSTGAQSDADAVPDYRIYEDETGTPILTGSMAKLDDAGTLGFYSEQVTLSAANGFESGKSYSVYVTAEVNAVAGGTTKHFQVGMPASLLNQIADGILTRDWTAVTGEAARSCLNAFRFLRNRYFVTGTTLTVTEEDDSTAAWTSTLSTDANADPVTGSDPT